ncbi:hypothetical protein BDB01DRAFT_812550 [Pilobolus umbonatus]|nr:hypothetical protein BDB01DRAFT_812550 [Pilobolus umbonatus]
MGLIDKLKNNYEYYKVDKYTKRRNSQSQFTSHDSNYYQQVYRNGSYINPGEVSHCEKTSVPLAYKQSLWTVLQPFKKTKKSPSINMKHLNTSEAYTLGLQ